MAEAKTLQSSIASETLQKAIAEQAAKTIGRKEAKELRKAEREKPEKGRFDIVLDPVRKLNPKDAWKIQKKSEAKRYVVWHQERYGQMPDVVDVQKGLRGQNQEYLDHVRKQTKAQSRTEKKAAVFEMKQYQAKKGEMKKAAKALKKLPPDQLAQVKNILAQSKEGKIPADQQEQLKQILDAAGIKKSQDVMQGLEDLVAKQKVDIQIIRAAKEARKKAIIDALKQIPAIYNSINFGKWIDSHIGDKALATVGLVGLGATGLAALHFLLPPVAIVTDIALGVSIVGSAGSLSTTPFMLARTIRKAREYTANAEKESRQNKRFTREQPKKLVGRALGKVGIGRGVLHEAHTRALQNEAQSHMHSAAEEFYKVKTKYFDTDGKLKTKYTDETGTEHDVGDETSHKELLKLYGRASAGKDFEEAHEGKFAWRLDQEGVDDAQLASDRDTIISQITNQKDTLHISDIDLDTARQARLRRLEAQLRYDTKVGRKHLRNRMILKTLPKLSSFGVTTLIVGEMNNFLGVFGHTHDIIKAVESGKNPLEYIGQGNLIARGQHFVDSVTGNATADSVANAAAGNYKTGVPSSHDSMQATAKVTTGTPDAANCFVVGTLILMADGTEKKIEDVVIGDTVYSYEEESEKIVTKHVLAVVSESHTHLVRLAFSNGTVNTNTPNHRYFVKGKGWASCDPVLTQERDNALVQQLELNDVVFAYVDGKLEEVILTEITNIAEATQTYNLSNIADTHTFFANRILVHNVKSARVTLKAPTVPGTVVHPDTPSKIIPPDGPLPKSSPDAFKTDLNHLLNDKFDPHNPNSGHAINSDLNQMNKDVAALHNDKLSQDWKTYIEHREATNGVGVTQKDIDQLYKDADYIKVKPQVDALNSDIDQMRDALKNNDMVKFGQLLADAQKQAEALPPEYRGDFPADIQKLATDAYRPTLADLDKLKQDSFVLKAETSPYLLDAGDAKSVGMEDYFSWRAGQPEGSWTDQFAIAGNKIGDAMGHVGHWKDSWQFPWSDQSHEGGSSGAAATVVPSGGETHQSIDTLLNTHNPNVHETPTFLGNSHNPDHFQIIHDGDHTDKILGTWQGNHTAYGADGQSVEFYGTYPNAHEFVLINGHYYTFEPQVMHLGSSAEVTLTPLDGAPPIHNLTQDGFLHMVGYGDQNSIRAAAIINQDTAQWLKAHGWTGTTNASDRVAQFLNGKLGHVHPGLQHQIEQDLQRAGISRDQIHYTAVKMGEARVDLANHHIYVIAQNQYVDTEAFQNTVPTGEAGVGNVPILGAAYNYFLQNPGLAIAAFVGGAALNVIVANRTLNRNFGRAMYGEHPVRGFLLRNATWAALGIPLTIANPGLAATIGIGYVAPYLVRGAIGAAQAVFFHGQHGNGGGGGGDHGGGGGGHSGRQQNAPSNQTNTNGNGRQPPPGRGGAPAKHVSAMKSSKPPTGKTRKDIAKDAGITPDQVDAIHKAGQKAQEDMKNNPDLDATVGQMVNNNNSNNGPDLSGSKAADLAAGAMGFEKSGAGFPHVKHEIQRRAMIEKAKKANPNDRQAQIDTALGDMAQNMYDGNTGLKPSRVASQVASFKKAYPTTDQAATDKLHEEIRHAYNQQNAPAEVKGVVGVLTSQGDSDARVKKGLEFAGVLPSSGTPDKKRVGRVVGAMQEGLWRNRDLVGGLSTVPDDSTAQQKTKEAIIKGVAAAFPGNAEVLNEARVALGLGPDQAEVEKQKKLQEQAQKILDLDKARQKAQADAQKNPDQSIQDRYTEAHDALLDIFDDVPAWMPLLDNQDIATAYTNWEKAQNEAINTDPAVQPIVEEWEKLPEEARKSPDTQDDATKQKIKELQEKYSQASKPVIARLKGTPDQRPDAIKTAEQELIKALVDAAKQVKATPSTVNADTNSPDNTHDTSSDTRDTLDQQDQLHNTIPTELAPRGRKDVSSLIRSRVRQAAVNRPNLEDVVNNMNLYDTPFREAEEALLDDIEAVQEKNSFDQMNDALTDYGLMPLDISVRSVNEVIPVEVEARIILDELDKIQRQRQGSIKGRFGVNAGLSDREFDSLRQKVMGKLTGNTPTDTQQMRSELERSSPNYYWIAQRINEKDSNAGATVANVKALHEAAKKVNAELDRNAELYEVAEALATVVAEQAKKKPDERLDIRRSAAAHVAAVMLSEKNAPESVKENLRKAIQRGDIVQIVNENMLSENTAQKLVKARDWFATLDGRDITPQIAHMQVMALHPLVRRYNPEDQAKLMNEAFGNAEPRIKAAVGAFTSPKSDLQEKVADGLNAAGWNPNKNQQIAPDDVAEAVMAIWKIHSKDTLYNGDGDTFQPLLDAVDRIYANYTGKEDIVNAVADSMGLTSPYQQDVVNPADRTSYTDNSQKGDTDPATAQPKTPESGKLSPAEQKLRDRFKLVLDSPGDPARSLTMSGDRFDELLASSMGVSLQSENGDLVVYKGVGSVGSIIADSEKRLIGINKPNTPRNTFMRDAAEKLDESIKKAMPSEWKVEGYDVDTHGRLQIRVSKKIMQTRAAVNEAEQATQLQVAEGAVRSNIERQLPSDGERARVEITDGDLDDLLHAKYVGQWKHTEYSFLTGEENKLFVVRGGKKIEELVVSSRDEKKLFSHLTEANTLSDVNDLFPNDLLDALQQRMVDSIPDGWQLSKYEIVDGKLFMHITKDKGGVNQQTPDDPAAQGGAPEQGQEAQPTPEQMQQAKEVIDSYEAVDRAKAAYEGAKNDVAAQRAYIEAYNTLLSKIEETTLVPLIEQSILNDQFVKVLESEFPEYAKASAHIDEVEENDQLTPAEKDAEWVKFREVQDRVFEELDGKLPEDRSPAIQEVQKEIIDIGVKKAQELLTAAGAPPEPPPHNVNSAESSSGEPFTQEELQAQSEVKAELARKLRTEARTDVALDVTNSQLSRLMKACNVTIPGGNITSYDIYPSYHGGDRLEINLKRELRRSPRDVFGYILIGENQLAGREGNEHGNSSNLTQEKTNEIIQELERNLRASVPAGWELRGFSGDGSDISCDNLRLKLHKRGQDAAPSAPQPPTNPGQPGETPGRTPETSKPDMNGVILRSYDRFEEERTNPNSSEIILNIQYRDALLSLITFAQGLEVDGHGFGYNFSDQLLPFLKDTVGNGQGPDATTPKVVQLQAYFQQALSPAPSFVGTNGLSSEQQQRFMEIFAQAKDIATQLQEGGVTDVQFKEAESTHEPTPANLDEAFTMIGVKESNVTGPDSVGEGMALQSYEQIKEAMEGIDPVDLVKAVRAKKVEVESRGEKFGGTWLGNTLDKLREQKITEHLDRMHWTQAERDQFPDASYSGGVSRNFDLPPIADRIIRYWQLSPKQVQDIVDHLATSGHTTMKDFLDEVDKVTGRITPRQRGQSAGNTSNNDTDLLAEVPHQEQPTPSPEQKGRKVWLENVREAAMEWRGKSGEEADEALEELINDNYPKFAEDMHSVISKFPDELQKILEDDYHLPFENSDDINGHDIDEGKIRDYFSQAVSMQVIEAENRSSDADTDTLFNEIADKIFESFPPDLDSSEGNSGNESGGGSAVDLVSNEPTEASVHGKVTPEKTQEERIKDIREEAITLANTFRKGYEDTNTREQTLQSLVSDYDGFRKDIEDARKRVQAGDNEAMSNALKKYDLMLTEHTQKVIDDLPTLFAQLVQVQIGLQLRETLPETALRTIAQNVIDAVREKYPEGKSSDDSFLDSGKTRAVRPDGKKDRVPNDASSATLGGEEAPAMPTGYPNNENDIPTQPSPALASEEPSHTQEQTNRGNFFFELGDATDDFAKNFELQKHILNEGGKILAPIVDGYFTFAQDINEPLHAQDLAQLKDVLSQYGFSESLHDLPNADGFAEYAYVGTIARKIRDKLEEIHQIEPDEINLDVISKIIKGAIKQREDHIAMQESSASTSVPPMAFVAAETPTTAHSAAQSEDIPLVLTNREKVSAEQEKKAREELGKLGISKEVINQALDRTYGSSAKRFGSVAEMNRWIQEYARDLDIMGGTSGGVVLSREYGKISSEEARAKRFMDDLDSLVRDIEAEGNKWKGLRENSARSEPTLSQIEAIRNAILEIPAEKRAEYMIELSGLDTLLKAAVSVGAGKYPDKSLMREYRLDWLDAGGLVHGLVQDYYAPEIFHEAFDGLYTAWDEYLSSNDKEFSSKLAAYKGNNLHNTPAYFDILAEALHRHPEWASEPSIALMVDRIMKLEEPIVDQTLKIYKEMKAQGRVDADSAITVDTEADREAAGKLKTALENARENISDSDVFDMVVEPYIRSAHTQPPRGSESINGLIDASQGSEEDVFKTLQEWYPSLKDNTEAKESISRMIQILTINGNIYGDYTNLIKHAFMQRFGKKLHELTSLRAPSKVYQDIPLLVLAPSQELFRAYIQRYYDFADIPRGEVADAIDGSRNRILALEKKVSNGEVTVQAIYGELYSLDQNLRNFLSANTQVA